MLTKDKAYRDGTMPEAKAGYITLEEGIATRGVGRVT
jgi:hypothetical protein